MNYSDFLDRKTQLGCDHGFEPSWMPSFLFDFQKSLVEWACRKGRAANSEAEERQQMRKWVGKTPSPKPQLWYTKGEALKAGAIRPVKVRFPFCWGWCDLYDGIKLTDGRTCPTHSAMLVVVNGVASDVVGMRDMQAVTWPEDLASAWRASFEQEL